jgi:hypothetical protein
MEKCATCLDGHCVVSENGFHYNCSLKEKDAMDCLTGKVDHYIKNPMKKSNEE